MEIIITPRLILRSPVADDLAKLHIAVLSDPEVMALALSGAPLTKEKSQIFFDENFDHERTGRKLGVLIERETKQIVGFAGLVSCTIFGQLDYELGFVLRRSVWGRGYATEIGRGQIEFGFGQLQLDRILAQAVPQNHASIATLKKIGMAFQGIVQNEIRGERCVYVANRSRGPG